MDQVVPIQVGRRVGVRASYGGVPAISQPGAVGITPIHIPTINRAGAVIGDTNCSGKASIPFVTYYVGTFAAADSHAAGR